VYPSENTELADCIVRAGGLLLSEYPVGEETTPYTLVARDRLQPALSQAVIVIKTDINGGTMHAVNAAAVVGKPVYAVEYRNNLEFKYDGGNKYLIQKHIARPITSSVDDISSLITSLNSVDTLPVLNEQLSLF
jgi:DNA processing protein